MGLPADLAMGRTAARSRCGSRGTLLQRFLENITPAAVVVKLVSDRDAQFRDELVRACDQVFQESDVNRFPISCSEVPLK